MDAIDRHVKQIIGNAVLKAYAPRPHREFCQQCDTTGEIFNPSTLLVEVCPRCDGTGEVAV